jgi:GrpB-like predicted nucleotidyltransferase (UPF0157 family)
MQNNTLGIDKYSVALQPHNENWIIEFEKEKAILQSILYNIDIEIAHVGSTAIKGLSAKPIIDIVLGVKNIEKIKAVAEVLEQNGYITKNHIDDRGVIFAAKENAPNCRTHHVHICVIGSQRWNEQVYFKMYLLEHPNIITEYENLKKGLAVKYFNNRTEYTAAKDSFIKSVLAKAYLHYGIK